jgi:hypothetical protein
VTALAAAPGHQAARRRPRWAALAWMTWRQQRAVLAGLAALLGAAAVILAVTGLRVHNAGAALARAGCPQAGALITSRCGRLQDALYHAGFPLSGNVPLVTIGLWAVPVLIGMFAGAPLIARELESGTYRFAWTQAAGRARWVTGRLMLLAAVLTAAAAAFGALAGWWLSQTDTDPLTAGSPWQPGQFGLTWVTFAGWTLLAFATGSFLGALIARTVAAMAATAAAVVGLAAVAFWKVTGLLTGLAPVSMRTSLTVPAAFAPEPSEAAFLPGGWVARMPAGSWPLRTWFTDAHGHLVSIESHQLYPLWDRKLQGEIAWLARHQLTLWISYQPAGRFWWFQAAAAGIAVLAAVLLGAATLWLTRRRTS